MYSIQLSAILSENIKSKKFILERAIRNASNNVASLIQ